MKAGSKGPEADSTSREEEVVHASACAAHVARGLRRFVHAHTIQSERTGPEWPGDSCAVTANAHAHGGEQHMGEKDTN